MLCASKFLNSKQIEFICDKCKLTKKDLERISPELDEEITNRMLSIECDCVDKGLDDKDVSMAIDVIDTWDEARWSDYAQA